MQLSLLDQIDKLIESYKEKHRGEKPLYIILSPEENKRARTEIQTKEKFDDENLITTYRDIKLAEHPSQLDGKMYVSNDLPETGS